MSLNGIVPPQFPLSLNGLSQLSVSGLLVGGSTINTTGNYLDLSTMSTQNVSSVVIFANSISTLSTISISSINFQTPILDGNVNMQGVVDGHGEQCLCIGDLTSNFLANLQGLPFIIPPITAPLTTYIATENFTIQNPSSLQTYVEITSPTSIFQNTVIFTSTVGVNTFAPTANLDVQGTFNVSNGIWFGGSGNQQIYSDGTNLNMDSNGSFNWNNIGETTQYAQLNGSNFIVNVPFSTNQISTSLISSQIEITSSFNATTISTNQYIGVSLLSQAILASSISSNFISSVSEVIRSATISTLLTSTIGGGHINITSTGFISTLSTNYLNASTAFISSLLFDALVGSTLLISSSGYISSLYTNAFSTANISTNFISSVSSVIRLATISTLNCVNEVVSSASISSLSIQNEYVSSLFVNGSSILDGGALIQGFNNYTPVFSSFSSINYAGLMIGWNGSGGNGETDFYNCGQFGNGGGFYFYSCDSGMTGSEYRLQLTSTNTSLYTNEFYIANANNTVSLFDLKTTSAEFLVNVGIGIANPSYALEVAGLAFVSGSNGIYTGSDIVSSFIRISESAGNSYLDFVNNLFFRQSYSGANILTLNSSEALFYQPVYPSGDNTSSLGALSNRWSEVFCNAGYFTSSVGIGISNPSNTLQVLGSYFQYGGAFQVLGNSNTPIYSAFNSTSGLIIGWNASGINGETDFFNNGQGGSGGFNFYYCNSGQTTCIPLLTINPTSMIISTNVSTFGNVIPSYGNTYSLGNFVNLWSGVYSQTGFFNSTVGINVEYPTAQLEVNGNCFFNAVGGNGVYIGYDSNTGGDNMRLFLGSAGTAYCDFPSTLNFRGTGGGSTPFYITSYNSSIFSGTVGINISNPSVPFEVVGSTIISGSFYQYCNLGGALPSYSTYPGGSGTGSYYGWNGSNGRGETTIVNGTGGGSTGGFSFYNCTSISTSAKLLFYMAPTSFTAGYDNTTSLGTSALSFSNLYTYNATISTGTISTANITNGNFSYGSFSNITTTTETVSTITTSTITSITSFIDFQASQVVFANVGYTTAFVSITGAYTNLASAIVAVPSTLQVSSISSFMGNGYGFFYSTTASTGVYCGTDTGTNNCHFWFDGSNSLIDCGSAFSNLQIRNSAGAVFCKFAGYETTFNTNICPLYDNVSTVGKALYRWSAIWSANGTIQTSDATLKNYRPLRYGLIDVIKISTIQYSWKNLHNSDITKDYQYYGFHAQNLSSIFPELVYSEEPNAPLQVNYTELIPITVNAIQELASTQNVHYSSLHQVIISNNSLHSTVIGQHLIISSIQNDLNTVIGHLSTLTGAFNNSISAQK